MNIIKVDSYKYLEAFTEFKKKASKESNYTNYSTINQNKLIFDHCIGKNKAKEQNAWFGYLAVDGDEVVGWLLLMLDDDQTSLRIQPIAVLESQYGKGTAKSLIDKAKQVAKDEGVDILDLIVHKGNKRAISFYEKQGFVLEAKRGRNRLLYSYPVTEAGKESLAMEDLNTPIITSENLNKWTYKTPGSTLALYIYCPRTKDALEYVYKLGNNYKAVLVDLDEIILKYKSLISDEQSDEYALERYLGFANQAITDLITNKQQVIVFGTSIKLLPNVIQEPTNSLIHYDTSMSIVTYGANCIKEELENKPTLERFERMVLDKIRTEEELQNASLLSLEGLEPDALEMFLESCSPKVQNNVEVVTPDILGQDFLLHISKDKNIKTFIPQIGHRQGDTEDRTVPRVCMSDSLLGCIDGYQGIYYDFNNLASDGKEENLKFTGGYVIYSVDFEYALKPSDMLVYDADQTNEHWLVSYDKETAEYVPTEAGKFFIRSINYVGRNSDYPYFEPIIYAEIVKEGGIRFTKDLHLDQGYWIIEGTYDQKTKLMMYLVKEIDKTAYFSAKNQTAALLHHDAPAFLSW